MAENPSEHPDTGGSWAKGSQFETAVQTDNCRYVLSVLDHVLLHQTIIGQETRIACEKHGIKPDIIIGCTGGGSNFGGLIAPFISEKIAGKSDVRIIGVEPASCPSLTRGKYAYDFGDTGKTSPLMKMYTLGSGFIPSPSHAGGLRFHGMSPIISNYITMDTLKPVRWNKPVYLMRQLSLPAVKAFCRLRNPPMLYWQLWRKLLNAGNRRKEDYYIWFVRYRIF